MDYSNYTGNISRAVAYTEKGIRAKAPSKDTAKAAGMSEASLWRVFKFAFHTTLSTYRRERRLTLVAQKLISTSRTITDICMEYGCDSPEIITRSFKKQFGVTPQQYRKAGVNRHFLERQRLSGMTIRHVMSGGISRRPVIRRDGGFSISGFTGKMRLSSGIKTVTQIYTRHIMKHGARISGPCTCFYAGVPGRGGLFDISRDTPIDIALGSGGRTGHRRVPAGRYAVFMHDAPSWTMLASYEYIFGYWMRGKKLKAAPAYVFQIIDNSRSSIRRVRSEICIPIG